MKAIVFLCILGVAYAEVSLHAVFQAKWNNFKATHGKQYHRHEEPHRLNAFLSNSLHIENHNERFAKGLETYELGHNQFSDMPNEEFRSTVTTLQVPPVEQLANVTRYQIQGLGAPMGAQVDWTPYLPPVKNQGSCGSCYAFGSLVPLEALVNKRHGKRNPSSNINLSEQEIVDCSNRQGNNGCNGGFMTNVYNYIKGAGGVHSQSEYSYEGAQKSCRARSSKAHGSIASFVNVDTEQATTDAVLKVGPIAAAVTAGARSFQFYSRGILTDTNCGAQNIDHAVAIIGAGCENNINYYLVRNSWGTGWGEHGHIRMARNICQIHKWGYYPVLR